MKKHDNKPYMELGSSIENFLRIEQSLIRIFCAITVLAILQMLIFRSFWSFSGSIHQETISKYSMASLGESTSLCSKAPYIEQEPTLYLAFSCHKGYTIQEVLALGILGDRADEEDNLTDINTECIMDKISRQKTIDEINLIVWRDKLLSKCGGLKNCLFDIEYNEILVSETSAATLLINDTVFFA